MSVLINKAAVKKYALHLSKSNRGGKFTRISGEFLEAINGAVVRAVIDRVHCHPSVGKTLK